MTKLAIFQAVLLFTLTAQMPPLVTNPSTKNEAKEIKSIDEPVFYFPTKVAFWNASSGLSKTERIFLRQGDSHPLKIKSVLTNGHNLSAEIVKSGGKQKLTYTIAVTLGPKAPPGPVSGKVIIKTDHPEAETILIPVRGNVLADIAVTPPTISIRLKKATGKGQGVVSITSTNGKKFKVLAAKVDSPGVNTDVRAVKEGAGHLILITVSRPDRGTRKPQQVLLHINVDAPQKVIVVPIAILP